MNADPIPGACLCGAIRFALTPPTLFCGHCHCSICRRSHGAAFVTWLGVARDRFELVAGLDELARYASSDHGVRSFCARCGSSLFSESSQHPGQIEVTLASLQGAIDRAPEEHVYFDDRVPWAFVRDDLRRSGAAPASEEGEEGEGHGPECVEDD